MLNPNRRSKNTIDYQRNDDTGAGTPNSSEDQEWILEPGAAGENFGGAGLGRPALPPSPLLGADSGAGELDLAGLPFVPSSSFRERGAGEEGWAGPCLAR